jgi:tRNA pseudouridine38-40 synthase
MTSRPTKRIAFTVHYDGGRWFGWQLQPNEPSVQGEIERVLGKLFDRPARVLGSGRTDRGVHATGQVAIVDAPESWAPAELRRAMNALLHPSVWIARAAEVPGDFHPRYDAVSRSYIYRLGLSEVTASPFHAGWCWSLRRPVDSRLLDEAATTIIGEHSFRAFAKAGQEERGDRCTVLAAQWQPWSDLGREFHITANRFLHHMVRYLVGTMVEIGRRQRPPEDLKLLLLREGGLETSPPAPAQGLFLSAVTYPAGQYDGPLPDIVGVGPTPL